MIYCKTIMIREMLLYIANVSSETTTQTLYDDGFKAN